jgi:hypothetical protein
MNDAVALVRVGSEMWKFNIIKISTLFGEGWMGPKYAAGAKVRIKAHDFLGIVLDPEIQHYENMMGEILNSINIVAFISDPWAKIGGTEKRISIYHYTVRISDQITLYDVTEDCLEGLS